MKPRSAPSSIPSSLTEVQQRIFRIHKQLRRIYSLSITIQKRKDGLTIENVLKRFPNAL